MIQHERIIKSTQEQAMAAWIQQLNQIRLNELISKLNQQDKNLTEALSELEELKEFIGDPNHILGSSMTKHGEIAEHVQVNFSNARNLIDGLKREYTFEGVGRTAPEDYLFKGMPVQSKYYNGAKNTLVAIQKHLEKYPNFVTDRGTYDIPKDHYGQMEKVLKLSKTNPSALSKEEYRLLNAIKEFEKNTGLSFGENVHSGIVDYSEVQTGAINQTIKNEEENIFKRDETNRNAAHKESEPTLKEGAKATIVAGAVEAGLTFGLAIHRKRKEGKHFSDFSEEDWKEIGLETGKGGIKGSIRGCAIYTLTNYTATPANVASAYVTAAFGIGAQLHSYNKGEISEEDLFLNCEAVCMDAAVSAISSLIGQTLIPVPVLGSVIGNVVGQFVYEIGKEIASEEQKKLIDKYETQLNNLETKLEREHILYIQKIKDSMKRFESLEQLAFDINVNIAFDNSIKLALEVGVEEKKVLKTDKEIFDFFMG